VPCIIRTENFEVYFREKKCALYTSKYGMTVDMCQLRPRFPDQSDCFSRYLIWRNFMAQSIIRIADMSSGWSKCILFILFLVYGTNNVGFPQQDVWSARIRSFSQTFSLDKWWFWRCQLILLSQLFRAIHFCKSMTTSARATCNCLEGTRCWCQTSAICII